MLPTQWSESFFGGKVVILLCLVAAGVLPVLFFIAIDGYAAVRS